MPKRKSSKGGKKDRKSSKKSRKSQAEAEPRPSKGKKGRKSSKGGKGRKSKKSVVSKPEAKIAQEAQVAPPPPPPEEPKKPVCNDQAPVEAPCRYMEDACCKEAVLCRPNSYPGLLKDPQPMAIVGSEDGTYSSICNLLRVGFRCADRVFVMVPWGNYVTFRSHNNENKIFFIFDGCTCNVNRFRYMDLTCGTAGLLYLPHMYQLINYIINSREMRKSLQKIRKSVVDDICHEFCEFAKR